MTETEGPLINAIVRIQNILLDPKREWETIAQEKVSIKELLIWHILPLAAIGPSAGFFGASFVSVYRIPIFPSLWAAAVAYIFTIVGVLLLGFIIYGLNILLDDDGKQLDKIQAIKITAYAYTPLWMAGVLYAIPPLSLVPLIIGVYSLYLLHSGLNIVLNIPEWKANFFAGIIAVCVIALGVVTDIVGKSRWSAYANSQMAQPRRMSTDSLPPPSTVKEQSGNQSQGLSNAAGKFWGSASAPEAPLEPPRQRPQQQPMQTRQQPQQQPRQPAYEQSKQPIDEQPRQPAYEQYRPTPRQDRSRVIVPSIRPEENPAEEGPPPEAVPPLIRR